MAFTKPGFSPSSLSTVSTEGALSKHESQWGISGFFRALADDMLGGSGDLVSRGNG